jgi:hypothetical protein
MPISPSKCPYLRTPRAVKSRTSLVESTNILSIYSKDAESRSVLTLKTNSSSLELITKKFPLAVSKLTNSPGALINQSCNVGRKDRRKFLDGIYVSERGFEKAEAQ